VSAVEEQLAWEAEQRPRAALAAILAGLLTLAGNVVLAVLFRNGPGEEDGFVTITESLGARLQGAATPEQSLLVRQIDYYGDNIVPFLLSTLLIVAGAALTGLTLAYLFRALSARLPDVGRLPIIMTVIGTVSFVVGRLVRDVAIFVGAAGFEDAAQRTAAGARDVAQSGTVLGGGFFEQIGLFALGVAIGLVAFHAMRAGLLTRFLGILGIIVGVLAIPLFGSLDQPQIIRTVWLLAVGWIAIAGRGRLGLLPAWQTGRAEPWPSQQQLREQRQASRPRPAPEPSEPAADAEPAGGGAVSATQPSKRRRKRRK